jgi:hypothetical protein
MKRSIPDGLANMINGTDRNSFRKRRLPQWLMAEGQRRGLAAQNLTTQNKIGDRDVLVKSSEELGPPIRAHLCHCGVCLPEPTGGNDCASESKEGTRWIPSEI